MENEKYLTEQIITYLGNKRKLLPNIENEVKNVLQELKKDKVIICDLFSGSGVVARMLKQYSSMLIVNDLERYSCLINDCYLTNKNDFDEKLYKKYINNILSEPLIERNYNK